MNEINTERSKSWNIYSNSVPREANQEAPWKNFGSSMNAISFGFVATAILISMFLIMAIFEHLFKPNPSFSSTQQDEESRTMEKHINLQVEITSYASDFSVLMPGQQYPTFIAQPSPLPCQREGVCWPPHEYNFAFP